VSELNAEYVESIVKLGLIEYKKTTLVYIGTEVMDPGGRVEYIAGQVANLEAADALIRDSKKLRQIAEQIVKASK
jgi:hypothetical protein